MRYWLILFILCTFLNACSTSSQSDYTFQAELQAVQAVIQERYPEHRIIHIGLNDMHKSDSMLISLGTVDPARPLAVKQWFYRFGQAATTLREVSDTVVDAPANRIDLDILTQSPEIVFSKALESADATRYLEAEEAYMIRMNITGGQSLPAEHATNVQSLWRVDITKMTEPRFERRVWLDAQTGVVLLLEDE